MVSVLFPTGKSLLIVGYEINFNVYCLWPPAN